MLNIPISLYDKKLGVTDFTGSVRILTKSSKTAVVD